MKSGLRLYLVGFIYFGSIYTLLVFSRFLGAELLVIYVELHVTMVYIVVQHLCIVWRCGGRGGRCGGRGGMGAEGRRNLKGLCMAYMYRVR